MRIINVAMEINLLVEVNSVYFWDTLMDKRDANCMILNQINIVSQNVKNLMDMSFFFLLTHQTILLTPFINSNIEYVQILDGRLMMMTIREKV